MDAFFSNSTLDTCKSIDELFLVTIKSEQLKRALERKESEILKKGERSR